MTTELYNEYRKSDCEFFTDFLTNKIAELEKENAELKKMLEPEKEKRTVEACKICDNNCGYCKYACNCSTEVEI